MKEPICVASAAGGRPAWYAAKAAISETSSVAGAASAALTYVPLDGLDMMIAKLKAGVGVGVAAAVGDEDCGGVGGAVAADGVHVAVTAVSTAVPLGDGKAGEEAESDGVGDAVSETDGVTGPELLGVGETLGVGVGDGRAIKSTTLFGPVVTTSEPSGVSAGSIGLGPNRRGWRRAER